MSDPHSLHSSLRETILEHIITGEILRRLWQMGIYDAEILHSEFDAGGFDMVLSVGRITRHIQLKASRVSAKTARQTIHRRLFDRAAGCVIWIVVNDDLTANHYLWLDVSSLNPERLGVAKHTKGNSEGHKAERPNLRTAPRSLFTRIATLDDLLHLLLEEKPLP